MESQMTREEAEKLLPAMAHFVKCGNLWYYSCGTWRKQDSIIYEDTWDIQNIIEDKHFEIRKANALGTPIQCKHKVGKWDWHDTDDFGVFQDQYEFRIKPKEPVYEWQWLHTDANGFTTLSDFLTAPYDNLWTKFEPSKRLRND